MRSGTDIFASQMRKRRAALGWICWQGWPRWWRWPRFRVGLGLPLAWVVAGQQGALA